MKSYKETFEKEFYAASPNQTPAGYWGHIQILFPESKIPLEIVKKLDSFSMWRGNTSSSPKYSHWEISDDFFQAVWFLEKNGFKKIGS